MDRRTVVTLCGVGIGRLAGCLDATPDSGNGGGTSSRTDAVTETTSPETATQQRDAERNATPHEFVHVEPIADESAIQRADENETVAFQNLSAQRRETFRAALRRERAAADGWSYYDESRPVYVRYDDRWFRVFVAVH